MSTILEQVEFVIQTRNIKLRIDRNRARNSQRHREGTKEDPVLNMFESIISDWQGTKGDTEERARDEREHVAKSLLQMFQEKLDKIRLGLAEVQPVALNSEDTRKFMKKHEPRGIGKKVDVLDVYAFHLHIPEYERTIFVPPALKIIEQALDKTKN
uniref:Uncharacterized protein n=1 Tax=Moniliophthora roreri TaxID=221103 RepID=A0A0W0G695_MONRR